MLLVEDKGSGVLLSFWVPSPMNERLAWARGEAASELHMSLLYLGLASELGPNGVEIARRVARQVARSTPPLRVRASGLGRFCNLGGDPAKDAVVLLVDNQQLPHIYHRARRMIEAAGVPYRPVHGYTPHVTLAYLPSHGRAPYHRTRPLSWVFDKLSFSVGGVRETYRLGG